MCLAWQYVDIVDPVLSSIEAITQRCQQTLSDLAAAAAADDDDNDGGHVTHTYFHTLEVSFLTVPTVCLSILFGRPCLLIILHYGLQ